MENKKICCLFTNCKRKYDLSIDRENILHSMRKIILLIIILGVYINHSYSQVDSHFSLFEYSQNVFNPGAAGSNDAMCVTSTHRQQWVGYGNKGEGRPITTIFSFDMPISKISSGVGLGIIQDKIGFQNDIHVKFNYAYRADLDFAILGVGLGLGVINRTINPEWITPGSIGGNNVYLDPTLPHMANKTVFDVNIGATLVSKDYWAGFSITHLTNPTINLNVEVPSRLPQHIYLMGGYNYSLPNPSFDALASLIVQSDRFAKAEFQLNVKLLYEKKFWAGLSYRFTEAFVPMIGLHLVNGISVAYSYDIGMSKIGSMGSHEIMLRYCFNIAKNTTMTRSRNLRRL